MNLYYDNGREKKRGFIYVASRKALYYELALISCQTLKDYWPDSHVTLFTHENFLTEDCKIFDSVYTNIPTHGRTKMWCMARTPYTERTIYNDCDSIIRHRDVRKIFDHLDDCDLICGSHLVYTVGNLKWGYIDKAQKYLPRYHGALWGYHTNPLNLDFMQTWFDEYVKQRVEPWDKYADKYYQEWQQFDTFTMWRILDGSKFELFPEFERFKDLNIKILPRRWNSTAQDLAEDIDGPPVITQVDRGTWSKMPYVWSQIEERLKDERRTVKITAPRDPTLEYN